MQWGVERESRQRIPLDTEPVPVDTVGARVVVPNGGRLWCYSLGALAAAIAEREDITVTAAHALVGERYRAHLSHFATCPDANHHRSPR